MLGAKVIGFSNEPYSNTYIFDNSSIKDKITHVVGDIRNFEEVKNVFDTYNPEFVFHLAAQPLVRLSYEEPLLTMQTIVDGTVNVLECIRKSDSVKAAVIVTTDKVYKNKEQKKGYVESDELGGHDPYSASKVCSEVITKSYRDSFFKHQEKLVATVRAGNVIGGGDFSLDRLIPDCIKKIERGETILVRNPNAVRPWQHVLEPIRGYLLLGAELLKGKKEFADAWNFASKEGDVMNVKDVVLSVIKYAKKGEWKDIYDESEKKHETFYLLLHSSKAQTHLLWTPKLDVNESIRLTMEWYVDREGKDCFELIKKQIEDYSN